MIFFVVTRAGFFPNQDATKFLNPYGISAVSFLAGLFTDKATLKLAEVLDAMFSTKKERSGSLNPKSETASTPTSSSSPDNKPDIPAVG